jgi:hypothetical protein
MSPEDATDGGCPNAKAVLEQFIKRSVDSPTLVFVR